MHVIQDENGKPVPHGHNHDHDHEHQHDHHHEQPQPKTQEQMIAVLDYMLAHNRHHTEELNRLAGKLEEMGYKQPAGQVRKAVDDYSKGNLYLGLALDQLKGEP